ncbi:hypothetical protein B0E45_03770 [Sinorhizobium sp. A49]|nr:hypothetical protein B0E45_03770 [Sinorhizobium sp. A49]
MRNGGSSLGSWHAFLAETPAPEWTLDHPIRNCELRNVTRIDFRIGAWLAWRKDDPTAVRDDIIDVARSLVRAGR